MAAPPNANMTELKLVSGNGRPTAANMTAAGPDVPLALGAAHVLRSMSGGEATVTLRELEVAIFLSVYVDKERLGAQQVLSVSLSLEFISAVIRSALVLGMDTDSRGSMKEALHYMVSFIRHARIMSPDDFTLYRSTSLQALPAAAPGRA